MSDLIQRAQKAKQLLGEVSLAKHERVEQALQAFSGLLLSDLAAAVREKLEAELVGVNVVVEPYSLEEDDDYQKIGDADLDRLLTVVDAAAVHAIDAELDRIVAELDEGVERLPEEAIREAREHRQLMVPRLMQVLKEAISAARAGERPKGNAPFLALFLLAEFKAQEAFPVMLEALTLPDDLPEDLFGDAVSELPSRIFALFLGDRIEAIEALVDDRSLHYSPRWEAAHSYLHLVRDGRLDRDEAVRLLQRHLRQAIDCDDDKIVTGLVCELTMYAPAEALDDIREAYERGLVEGFFIHPEDVEKSIAAGEARLRQKLGQCKSLDVDTLAELRRWPGYACKSNIGADDEPPAPRPQSSAASAPHFAREEKPLQPVREPIAARGPRVGRNDPCPCRSGKKFKKCCGART
jgi:hypothetical protein